MDTLLEDWPWWAQVAAVLLLLATSAFFSITETSMMAANRHRLKHKANQGHQGAKLASGLLGRTEELLSVILIGNNVINTFVPVLIAGIALNAFGNSGSIPYNRFRCFFNYYFLRNHPKSDRCCISRQNCFTSELDHPAISLDNDATRDVCEYFCLCTLKTHAS